MAQRLPGHSPWFEPPFQFTALEVGWFSDHPLELGTWFLAGLVAPGKCRAVQSCASGRAEVQLPLALPGKLV